MAKDAARRIDELREEIRHHDQKYYVQAAQEITDTAYDKLMNELKQLETANPNLVTPDSPTQRVGEQPVDHLPEVQHRVPMLSIENSYNFEDVRKWDERTKKLLDGEPVEYVVELKIDGAAATLIYENGVLVQGLTRGDGKTGSDITHNIRTVSDVPLKLIGDDLPSVLEVRGEIYMANSTLVQLNERQKEKGESLFANPRNVASGTITMLDPRVCSERGLRMFCHGVGYCEGLKSTNHIDFLAEIGSYGLPPTPNVESFPNIDATIQHCEELTEQLHDLDFEVDGLVLKLNRFDQREQLGTTSKSPRWVVAYKWEKWEATTQLNEIKVQVGKTGAITPVAELEPVELDRTIVSRASLHNADEIERKDIRVGDVVVVEKAGRIIPHIVRVEKHERKSRLRKFKFPTHCPECKTELVKDEGGVYIRCTNLECPAQLKERLIHFAGRKQMDIEGLGEEVVDQLLRANLVSHFADLFTLSVKQLAELTHTATFRGKERQVKLGEKNAERILNSLDESKQRGLARVLASLSIRHIGAQIAHLVASNFKDVNELMSASLLQVQRAVSEASGKNRFQNTEEVAIAFHSVLHSDEGKKRINKAKEDSQLPSSEGEVKLFLEGLPDGGKKWRIKWGKGGGKKDRILQHFDTLDDLGNATVDDFTNVFVDDVVGSSLHDFLHSDRGRTTIDKLREVGVNLTSHEPQTTVVESPLSGKTIVVTGSFEKISRDKIHEMIRSRGGKPTSSVSKKTDFVLAGENPGSKLDKARRLGVTVMTTEDFEELFEQLEISNT